ncbi:transcriptional regulator [Vibrio sp. SM6]|uniref:Transcriptional regulator n=1 Tax=Vibrio agarilyticus TaxID=2726741 RepID=A0A7X8TQP0_9VIBR|nr:autoinducer binding domain-containing protein [Vibrio agarilyticus]NLS12975.1 transcriptional regulator [Vibrio agarilyticus]
METQDRIAIENLVEDMALCDDKNAFIKLMDKACDNLGFEHFAFGLKKRAPFATSTLAMANNYTDAWNDRYQNQGLVFNDPLVGRALRSSSAIDWNELYDEGLPFWQEARVHGLVSGWSNPVHSPDGTGSMISFSRGQSSYSKQELVRKTPYMLWVSHVADQKFRQFMLDKPLEPADYQLTRREVEMLKWAADGKTTFEIAMILNISQKTVEFHHGNAMRKFGTPNITATVVKAMLSGAI